MLNCWPKVLCAAILEQMETVEVCLHQGLSSSSWICDLSDAEPLVEHKNLDRGMTMKSRFVWLMSIVMVSVFILAACGGTTASNTQGGENNQQTGGGDQTGEGGQLQQTYLNLGATSQSSGIYSYFVAVADAAKKATDGKINMTVVETGATIDNLKRLQQKSIDLGLGTASINYKAYKGLDDWKDSPMPELRELYIFLPAPQPVVVTVESGVEKVEDLNGKSFFPGLAGSASETTSQEVFAQLGIQPKYFLGGLEDGVNAVKDRRAVGLVKSGVGLAPDPSVLDINSTLPVKILGFSEEQLQKIEELGLSTTVIPAGTYPNQTEDVHTYVIALDIITTNDLPEEVAYQIVKASVENKAEHEKAYNGVAPFDYIEDTLKYATVPLHAGVVRYFQEQGIEVPDHLIPPEMK